jgi:D-2-hydroxyacid dehydrogenase (NADP+)
MAELGLLVSARVLERHGESLCDAARAGRLELVPIVLPSDPDGRVAASDCARIEAAFFSGDLFPDGARAFFAAALGAPKLRWLQTFNAGIDHPIFARFL